MASVTIQKWTTAGACGGQINHIYRTREHYGNQDIDRALADRNEMAGTAEHWRIATRWRGRQRKPGRGFGRQLPR